MKATKRIMATVVALLMLAGCTVGLSSCKDKTKTPPIDPETGLMELYIGGIGPTTGDYSNYGSSVKKGAQIAVNEINAAGGFNGFKIKFDFQDSQGDPDSAVSAFGKQMDEGMMVSLGATFSGETASVVAAAKDDGILILTPSASSVNAIAGSDTAFRVCFSDPYQGIASAQYVRDYNLGTKVAVFYGSDNDYCVGLYDNFKDECAKLGIEIVTVQAFTESTNTDFSAQINAIKASGADVVFMPIYAAEAASFLTQAAGKLDGIKFFGCDGLDGLLTKISDVKYANGVLMLTPFTADSDNDKVKSFVAAYSAAYNGEIPDQFAADGYDAIYTIVAAIKKAGLNSEDLENFNSRIVAAMTQITVEGLTGTMQWTADGETTKAAKLMVFDNGKVIAYNKN